MRQLLEDAVTARDVRFGRSGGRVVEWEAPTAARPCRVCGMAVVTGGDVHHGCTTDPPPDDHPTLFDDEDDA